MNGGISGGTIASAIGMIENPPTNKSRVGFNPLLKLSGKDEKSSNKFYSRI